MDFAAKYGPWALVAGASEGIGAAFATGIAARGVNVVLVARRPEPLAALAGRLPVRVETVAADLSTAEGLATVRAATDPHEIGLVVCNAAYVPIGDFLGVDEAALDTAVRLNCLAPVLLARRYLPDMVARGRGGFVVMSSLAGNQGSPGISTYAATKAFGAVLAEGLWGELRGRGVDALACVAGAVATPGLDRALTKPAPGTVSPEEVARTALDALGRHPRVVPGTLMRLSVPLMNRLLPRRAMIRVMGNATKGLIE